MSELKPRDLMTEAQDERYQKYLSEIKQKINPFGICQRICDLNPENCGNCTEPLQCNEWLSFWELCEREWAEQIKFDSVYGPSKCDFCDDWYNCPDCPARLEQEEEDEMEERWASVEERT
jgi:hypothetical protein